MRDEEIQEIPGGSGISLLLGPGARPRARPCGAGLPRPRAGCRPRLVSERDPKAQRCSVPRAALGTRSSVGAQRGGPLRGACEPLSPAAACDAAAGSGSARSGLVGASWLSAVPGPRLPLPVPKMRGCAPVSMKAALRSPVPAAPGARSSREDGKRSQGSHGEAARSVRCERGSWGPRAGTDPAELQGCASWVCSVPWPLCRGKPQGEPRVGPRCCVCEVAFAAWGFLVALLLWDPRSPGPAGCVAVLQ